MWNSLRADGSAPCDVLHAGSQPRPVFLLRAVLVTIVLTLLPVLATPASASLELLKKQWVEVKTPAVTIMSLRSEKEALELAEELELFRAIVARVGIARRGESPIPTSVFLLKSRRQMVEMGVEEKDTVGMFWRGIRQNVIAMRQQRGMSSLAVVQHEYTHFLVRNQDATNYPRWYDEGFAELLASTHVKRDQIRLGYVPKHRLDSFQYTPLMHFKKIVDSSAYAKMNSEKRSMFYAQSWVLVHYLQLGREQDRVFADEMKSYLRLKMDGEDDIPAFEAAFGTDMKTLNRDLRSYLKTRMPAVAIERSEVTFTFEPEVRKIPEAEIATKLGQYQMQIQGDFEQAKAYFDRAVTLDPKLAGAHAGLGDLLKFAGEFDEALPHFERAVALAPDDPYVRIDMAEYWLDRAATGEAISARKRSIRVARKHFVAAWKLDDSIPEVYAMYGSSFMRDIERDSKKALDMLHEASSRLPGDLTIRLMLAMAYRAVGDNVNALATARRVSAWSHPGSGMEKQASELIRELDSATRTATTIGLQIEISVPGEGPPDEGADSASGTEPQELIFR